MMTLHNSNVDQRSRLGTGFCCQERGISLIEQGGNNNNNNNLPRI